MEYTYRYDLVRKEIECIACIVFVVYVTYDEYYYIDMYSK